MNYLSAAAPQGLTIHEFLRKPASTGSTTWLKDSPSGSAPQRRPSFLSSREETPFVRVALRDAADARPLSQELAPIRVVLAIQGFWGLADDRFAPIVGLPAPSETSNLGSELAKNAKVRDIKRRLRAIAGIRIRLDGLLGGDRERERHWLVSPLPVLNGRSALDLLSSGEIEDLLLVEEVVRNLTSN